MREDAHTITIPGLDLAPSRICLGTADYGTNKPAGDGLAVMDAYLEAGGNFLDTAHVYGAWAPGGDGASERTVGEWLRHSGARDRVVLATKGGHPPLDQMEPCRGRLAPDELAFDLSESLERLGTDTIDLYWLHRDNPDLPVGQIAATMAALVEGGRIRAWGVSNWPAERVEAALAYARANGLPAPVASQIEFSAAEPPVARRRRWGTEWCDDGARQWYEDTGFPVCAYSAQAQGYFGQTNAAWARAGFQGEAPRGGVDSVTNRRRLLRAIELAQAKGCTPNQVALAWLLHQRAHVTPIISTGNVEHLRESLGAPAVELTPGECALLQRG